MMTRWVLAMATARSPARPPTSPPPLWLQEEAWQGRGEHSLMRQELEKAKQTQQEDMKMLKTSFDNAWDEQASTRASTKGCGKGPPQRVRRGGLDEKASTKSSDQEFRRTIREIVVEAVARGWEMGFVKGVVTGSAQHVDADDLSYATTSTCTLLLYSYCSYYFFF